MPRTLKHRPAATRGSAIIAALVLCIITGLLVASILGLAIAEKRANRSSIVTLEARNAAESASEYVVAQVKTILQNTTDFSNVDFSTGDDAVTTPPTSYFVNTNMAVSEIEVVAGMETKGSPDLIYLDPTKTQFRDNNYAGNYAYLRRVPIAAKATLSSIGTNSTAYVAQNLEAYIMPLFTFAIFYNPDLELFPGPDMIVNGPVHTNGNLFVRKQSSSGASLDFLYRVSVAGGLYSKKANQPLLYMMRHGVLDTTDYTDDVRFKHPISGTMTALKGSSYWRDFYWDKSTESATTQDKFTTWADETYSTNLRTRENGIEPLEINGANGAAGRSFVKPPAVSDDAGTRSMQLARKAGLIIVVNPDDETRSALLPSGATVTLDPGSYRVYTQAGRELILPGQEYYGPSGSGALSTTVRNLPIKPAQVTSGGIDQPFANAVVRVASSGYASGGADFYDLRRVKNGHLLSPTSSKPHTPRPIRKIDIDMTNLKKAIDYSVNGVTSSTVYETAVPQASGVGAWNNSIYNPSATPAARALTNADAIYDATSEAPISASSFWNGGIYVLSVDAETKTTDTSLNPDRLDSGVRLINGRGRIASDDDEGLTIATNDALYVFGHYNADGAISTTSSSASSRYTEDDEAPCALMADAITLLSQPVFTESSGVYTQTRGWNDALSRLRIDTYSNYSSSWASTAPSTSNRIDGDNTSTRPGALPNWSTPAGSGTAYTGKLLPYSTEYSAAFLTGIVPSSTASGAYSGGAHNFPRFLEDWYTANSSTRATCAIRGSMVAFFASVVADEPWSLRFYQAPVRLWGLNADYIAGKLPPLTPNTIAMQQLNFRLLSKEQYDTLKTTIEAL